MNVVDIIKQTAKQRGLTIKELSEKAGIGPKTISKWRQQTPSSGTLQKVADVLGVSVDYLLGNTDEMHPASSSNEEMDSLDLDKALSEHGVARFQGKELSDDYKRAVLAVLNTLNSNDNKE